MMNLATPDYNYKPHYQDSYPNRVETLHTALRRASQLMHEEMDLVKKENHKTHRVTVEELYTDANNNLTKRKRRLQGLKRHGMKHPPLSTDLRYRTVHPGYCKDFELKVLNILDNHKKPKNDISKELNKQERMIKCQAQDMKTKRYQLCQKSLAELLRKFDHSAEHNTSAGSSSPSLITL